MNPLGVLQVVHLVRQDLSIAGKRAGLAGARSGLFMEQVRIVKEMREADKRNGRTGAEVRPRYMVWENVCFAGETLVACKSGYKRIDQIAVGDEVKTHTGMYRPVAKVMRTKNQAVVRLKVSGAEDIICTPNHPLYIMEKVYANAGKKQGRSFTKPRWEAAENLNDRCMVAYKLDEPTLPDNFITPDEAWALGRYMADGSVDLNRGTPRIFISVGNAKLEEAREHLHRLPYQIHENAPHATATNMVFSSQEFYNLVSGVGKGAGNKRVPPFVFDLPFSLQKCVLNGYISGDGYIRERGKCRELCCVTASRELAYGIARMIRNVYRVGANISVRKPKDGRMGGRIIKANYPCYCVTAALTNKNSTGVCKDGFVWQMVKSVEPCREKATVYNLSVWEDNTYGANDVVAHNCGAFSSNKGKDFAAVLEEIARIAEPGFSLSGLPEKWKWTKAGAIDGDGWSIAWRTHDAKDWGKTIRDSRTGNVIRLGTPQRRRRISVVADFGGESAAQIQFDRESVSGHPAESGAAGERPADAAESGTSYAVHIRGGCDGGGKGALVQTEKSGTLGTGNDQTIFTPTPINLMVATRCKALGRGTGFGVGEPGDPANTISAAHSHGVFATAIPINDKATRWQGGGESRNHDGSGNGLGIGKEGDPSPTLTAGDRHGVMCMNPWDAQSARVYDQDGAWHSLNANENGGMARDSVLCAGFKLGNSEKAHSIGYEEETSPTLNAECGGNKPAVVALDMTHACDVIRECGEQAPSLQARMGTDGNQVPLTYQDVTGTLSPGAHAGSYNGQDAYNDMLVCGASPDVAHALRAKANCAYREDAETYPVQNMVVRRLTPLECTRLQGYPDGWVDIGDWTDEKGKKHKDADRPKYKALGNSIALPFWDWMLRRMARYLPEGATLGSLFDGISGFNVCWARIHGAECCRWSSEIEQFPIAVTKKHFGDEKSGEKGDWDIFSGGMTW